MCWRDLLFLHWPVPAEALRPSIPQLLELDTWNGEAWVGIVPFRMTGIRPRFVPALPWISAFPELNVRTYVTADRKPGVWFFTLDAMNPLAIKIARWAFRLPYYRATMTCEETDGWVRYDSRRVERRAPEATFRARYRPTGEPHQATLGSHEHWLTERYCLYSSDRKSRVYRGEVHHHPWPLQTAEAVAEDVRMTESLGFRLPDIEPLAHFVRRLDMVAWRIHIVG